jgi:hypothetical protein
MRLGRWRAKRRAAADVRQAGAASEGVWLGASRRVLLD